ncbi:unnamed protein product [Dovyalis caffra]|uniref:Histone deacetylase interacting domain-containing protein n=1 Tax=Dovyalis caffra TaxID=77055 RepID=A0AAV1R618_9ROSI|nr:unnamed protein product [Dovyalis caffra]
MGTKRDYYGESQTYLKELRARLQDQPEKLSSFYRVMEDIRAQRDERSGRLEKVSDDVLARLKAILEGHCDLIRGLNLFLPPSYRFGVDDDDEAAEVEEEDEKETAAASAEKTMMLPGFEDAKDFINKLRMRGGKVWDDFLKVFGQVKDRRDLYEIIAPLCGDDTDLLEGFHRFMRASEAIPVASDHVPDSQDKDVNDGEAEAIKVDEQQEKQPENIKVCEENGKERKLVKKVGGFTVKAGGKVVMEKLFEDGLCFFEKVRKKLSCKISYRTFLKLFFYYTTGKLRKAEWNERIAAVIGKHPDLMDEFRLYVRNCEKVQVFRKKFEEEDEVQKIETRGCKQRDRKRRKYLYKSIQELDLSHCKRCTPSYLCLPKDYYSPSKHNRISEAELQVLNNQFLSVPSGTEDFFTRKSHENEQILFECEDDRYETDMLIGWFSSAVEYAEELEKSTADDNEVKKGSRTIFLRCLERLYDDQGLEVLQIFNEDPQHALPVLKVRLQQKLKELKDYQDELQKFFAMYIL